jgi:NAD(P)-dependent dehydrogenase (short-subunit alcohol dehydrogenase family)
VPRGSTDRPVRRERMALLNGAQVHDQADLARSFAEDACVSSNRAAGTAIALAQLRTRLGRFRRMLTAERRQLGGTVAFLCSDAASQITGTAISVDGGWTAQ